MKHIKLFEEMYITPNGELVDDQEQLVDGDNGYLTELDLNDRSDFYIFVETVNNTWDNSDANKSTTHGYRFNIDMKYQSDLDAMGIDWYEIERISNSEHPNYGKSFIEFHMMVPEIKD